MWTILAIMFYSSFVIFVITNHVMVNFEYKSMTKRHAIENREIRNKKCTDHKVVTQNKT